MKAHRTSKKRTWQRWQTKEELVKTPHLATLCNAAGYFTKWHEVEKREEQPRI